MLLNPRTADPETSDRSELVERLWLAGAVAVALLAGYLVATGAVAAVLATARGAHYSAATVFVAGLVVWLCAHQAPLQIGGAVLTDLPLGPTLLVGLLVAAVSAHLARRRGLHRPDQALAVVLSMALSHAAVGGCAGALLLNGSPTVDAFLCCGLTAAVGSAAGLTRRCGLLVLVRESVPEEVWNGLHRGALASAVALGAGALTTLLGTLLSLPNLQASLGRLPAGDAFGQSLLSLLYAPNAAVAGWSFATGTGLSAGRFALHPWSLVPGRLPELPLFAGLPTGGPHWWWYAALALPLVVSAHVGWNCRNLHEDPQRRMRVVAVAALVPSLAALLAGAVSGGSAGAFAISLHPVVLGAATFCWTAVPAAALAWFAGPREISALRIG